jgi:hypothetical protein
MLHSISGEYPYKSIYKADVLFYTQRRLNIAYTAYPLYNKAVARGPTRRGSLNRAPFIFPAERRTRATSTRRPNGRRLQPCRNLSMPIQ